MSHDEPALIAYVSGDLEAEALDQYEGHLMDCDECWEAVRDDRVGRDAAESLRELAPAGLRDRVRAAAELAATADGRSGRGRSRALLLGGLGAVIAVSVIMASQRSSDAPAVAAVARLALDPTRSLARAPIELRVGSETIRVSQVDGAVVANADHTFPMPSDARPLGPAAGDPWAAVRADLTLVCFSRPGHALIAAKADLGTLLRLGAALGFT